MRSRAEILADLGRAFPRQAINRETFQLYLTETADIPEAVLADVVRELVRSAEFFPTIRALRSAAAERLLGLPGEAEALAQVEGRMAWARGDQDDPAPGVHVLVLRAVQGVGGWHSFRTEDGGVVRGQFLRLYRDVRAEAIRDVQIGDLALDRAPALPELPAAPSQ